MASFAFSLLDNQPGALLKALNTIADLGFNMSKIESRPSKRELGEYIFYVDVAIDDKNDIKTFELLKENLRPQCVNLNDFGCYLSKNINLE